MGGYLNFYAITPSPMKNKLLCRIIHYNKDEELSGNGKLAFPRDYPFKPPGIQVLTPNGRFAPNTRICTSFSDYHPETWDPSWNVETIVLGLISFWLSDEHSAGAISTPDMEKIKMAAESLKYNFSKGPRF